MPPRVISSCIDVHFRYTFAGQQCENIFQYAYPEGTVPNTANLQALAGNLVSTMLPALRAYMPGGCVYREIFLRDLHAASGRAQYTQDLGGVPGNRVGEATPGNVACNIISRTGFTGRNNHGAKRMGPFVEADTVANELQSTIITALINVGLQWLVARNVGGMLFTPAVASALTHTRRAIAAVVLNNNFVDSQKTRLTGHGE